MTVRLIGGRLSADCSFADNHRLAADPNLLENSCTARESMQIRLGRPIRTPCRRTSRDAVSADTVVMQEVRSNLSTGTYGRRTHRL